MRDYQEAKAIQEEISRRLDPQTGDKDVIKRVRNIRDEVCKELVEAEKSTELSKEFEHGDSATGLISRFFINSRLKYIARREFNDVFKNQTGVDLAMVLDSPEDRKKQENAEWQIVTYSMIVYAIIGAIIGGIIGGLFLSALSALGAGTNAVLAGVAIGAGAGALVMGLAGAVDGYIGEKMGTRDMKANVRVAARNLTNNFTNEVADERNRANIAENKEKIEALTRDNDDLQRRVSHLEKEHKRLQEGGFRAKEEAREAAREQEEGATLH